ncbi:hypothetical protein BGZ61DRAFT_479583 [Ilyonectria robusta]|uniref:uncharacterized protein n=1 Tax=Ilyonectria robusta TaxID=1079257 RepID=UPI001E8E41CF|nr:uncharacterized protein BGZ61DRAFT_479583 [Ilyonectria robusta]KAH8686480.1 hypothetical protein BGZ61DRAFT_479583 [Ilyonectria robusta]
MPLPMSDSTCLHAPATDADAADTTDAGVADTTNPDEKSRKRLQNRVYQRTHRARMKNSGPGSKKRQRPYETDRWRLDEVENTPSAASLPDSVTRCVDNSIRIRASKVNNSCFTSRLDVTLQTLGEDEVEVYGRQLQVLSVSVGTEPCLWPPPPPLADHLLHLVNYNVFRGFFTNKAALSRVTTHIIQSPDRSHVVDIMKTLPCQTIIVPTGSNIPRHLIPTALQTQKPHATWIDFIPFPKIRDNLIAQEDRFDHLDFMEDVVGDVLQKLLFSNRKSTVEPQGSSHLVPSKGLDDGMTANRKGLVLWGEPHNPENWEATPEFLRKWGWTVDGCDELIKSSNHWRMLRGEEMMQFST